MLRFKKYLPSAIIILVAIVGCVGFLAYFNFQHQESAQQLIETNDKQIAKLEQFIKETEKKQAEAAKLAKEKKQAAAKAKAAAKKKAAAAAASAGAAPQSTTSQSKCQAKAGHDNPSLPSVIVNKKHCLSPVSFVPGDLVTVLGATISAKASGSLVNMFNAAKAAGVPLSVTSSYRSYATQIATYNHWVAVNGSQAAADQVSARPGYSENQTGFAVDLAAGGCSLECFGGTGQYRWMQAHAAEFGFIERYMAGQTGITGYSPEPWHYRYVGVAVAKDMKARGVKSLEAYWGASGGGY